jgi:hypothetical protein
MIADWQNVKPKTIIGGNMSERLLRCKVFKGMFSDERAIEYPAYGEQFSVFVPKAKVTEEREGFGKLAVLAFEENGMMWAVLPSAQPETIPVRLADLF